MDVPRRIRPAIRASLKHFAASVFIALVCAALVFGLWYPSPYGELVGGRELFLLMISVDVICGPLLTLIVFNPQKPTRELVRDIGFIVCLQLAALAFGMYTTIQARPVFLAFEKDIFRVVVLPEVDIESLSAAPENLHTLSYSGPRLISTRIAQPTDPDFLQSVRLSVEGLHPAFRPGRWLNYAEQRGNVIAEARSLAQLRSKHSEKQHLIDELLQKNQLTEQQAGYLPLTAKMHTDWVVIVRRDDARVVGFLPLDGW